MERIVKNRFSDVVTKGLETGDKTKTQQQFKDSADINQIVKRFKKTGVLQSTIGSVHAKRPPVFGEYPYKDFVEMYEHVTLAKEQFAQLPASVRKRFDNNPANLIRFVEDAQTNPKSLKEALKLGIMQLPEGYELDKAGNITQQMEADLSAPKADPEANPGFNKP